MINRESHMRTSVSIMDALFGERVSFEVPDGQGGKRQVSVTKKWLDKMIAEKRISQVPDSSIVLFMDGPNGERTATLKIGEDIEQTTVDEFRDPETNAIYGMYCYEAGQEKSFLVQRSLYEETQKKLNNPAQKAFIDAEVDRALGRIHDGG